VWSLHILEKYFAGLVDDLHATRIGWQLFREEDKNGKEKPAVACR
jgi:hypothetical protein